MELTGPWRAAPADEDTRRAFGDRDFDDAGWETVTVPGHWRSVPAFADSDGPFLYRTRFDHERTGDTTRSWLVLDGVFYQSDVWLDGTYLGDTEGYFFPHTFEITDALAGAGEHVLAVEVSCPPQRERTRKRSLTGVFQHWDAIDADWNPGGLWRPVRTETTGPVRIRDLTVACLEATVDYAVVRFAATLDAAEPQTVELTTTVGPADHLLVQPLAAGANRLSWTMVVAEPTLWWPRALGSPSLVDVWVDVRLANGSPGGNGNGTGSNARSDRRRMRTGLRQVDLRDWVCRVNGERLFLKGTNYGPTRAAIADAAADEIGRDVDLMVGAGLDLVRVHGHIGRPELYDATDRAGLLVWQDLPLQWGYARSVKSQAVRQAEEAVKLLGHHPSIAVWCGHNEPMAVDIEPGWDYDDKEIGRLGLRLVAGQTLPSWNRSILDHSIKRALEEADGTRPVVAHSGVLPHPPLFEGTDSHLYFGWYWGEAAQLPGFLAAWPRLARFVSEFGAQAVPEDAGFCRPERWPELDWATLGRRHGLQRRFFDRTVPPDDFATFDEWRTATQRYQAELLKRHVETFRRLKYRPTGGFAQFLLADAQPAVSWSVLGHDRQAKPGYAALAEACRPVIVVADWPAPTVSPGERLSIDVHVVSDLRHSVTDATVVARLHWSGGDRVWRWRGDVPADGCVRVGSVAAEVPAARGELRLELLVYGPVRAANVYRSEIVSRGGHGVVS
ncbi:MAG: glycoside hydrolase family 2 protein [Acidimicrobiales bacterium]